MEVENKEWKQRILKEYLGEFLAPPLLDKDKLASLEALFKGNPDKFYAIKVKDTDEMKKVGQYYLLSFRKRVFWQAFNTYEFIQTYLNGEDPLALSREFNVAIIYHTGKEMANKRLPELVDQIVEFRRMKGLYTLFMSFSSNAPFSFSIQDPWVKQSSSRSVDEV